MKPEEKWNNHVIEVLDREHGKKVIEWWKEQGVGIGNYVGSVTKENGNTCIYYGVIDSVFENYTIEKVNHHNAKIITLPESKQSNKMKITSEQAQQIIDMVIPSCKWKERLLDLWAKNIVLKQEIDVDDSLYREGYNDASESQKKVLDGIFGKSKEINLLDGTGLNGMELFNKGSNYGRNYLISVTMCSNDSFWLSEKMEWRIEGNKLLFEPK